MAWYEDLAACDYWDLGDAGRLRAVGWLARGKPFTTGEVDERVFDKLCELTQNPWSHIVSCGIHLCELCRFTGNGSSQYKTFSVSAMSSKLLFVPGDGILYVSPTSITHYIDAHGYCPPAKFCEAVLRCPAMRSMAYLKAILANGGRELGMSVGG